MTPDGLITGLGSDRIEGAGDSAGPGILQMTVWNRLAPDKYSQTGEPTKELVATHGVDERLEAGGGFSWCLCTRLCLCVREGVCILYVLRFTQIPDLGDAGANVIIPLVMNA